MKETDKTVNELVDLYLNDDAAGEFDAIVAGYRRKKIVRRSLACVAASLIAVAALVIRPNAGRSSGLPFSTVEIAQNIETLFKMDSGDIISIMAKPAGDKVILTATMKDGSTNTFIMSHNGDGGSTILLAQNNNR